MEKKISVNRIKVLLDSSVKQKSKGECLEDLEDAKRRLQNLINSVSGESEERKSREPKKENTNNVVEENIHIPSGLVDDLLKLSEQVLLENNGKDCFRWRYLMDTLANRPKQTGKSYHNGTPHGHLYHQKSK